METTILKRHTAAVLCTAGFILALAAFLLFPAAVRASTLAGISYCLSVLAPSLFPFMALSAFAVNSPASQALGRPLDGFVRRVFRLPGCCALPILMSFIGGYPAGAKGASLLLEQGLITRRQASRMMLFCVNPGLAFVVTFLGLGVLGSTRLGWLLFLSVTLAGLLLGVLTALGADVPEKSPAQPLRMGSGALMRSVTDAARSVLVMSACVVLFSVLTAVLHQSGAFQTAVRLLCRTKLFSPLEWAALLSFLIEVTGGVGDAAALSAPPVLYAFGLAFGGFCVHMQVLAFFPAPPVKISWFLLGRLAHGGLAALCFLTLNRLMGGAAIQTAAPVAGGVQLFSGSILGGASLLLMCLAFLVITQNGKAKE
ncbi:sporulation protein [Acutalibacter caecimuris]|uniref:sporulation protein n=1 Tax=Acutalibacter caecimuris TaxID=3093657 RepID=UPI002AC97A5F|nr:sporulation protein [Acutalibacter sp. M00118]